MANEKKQKKAPQDPEAARRKKEEQGRRARRRNRQIIGIVLTVLIIWGAVSIVQSGAGLVQNLLDDTEEKLEYQERITPMVWFDVLPFSDVSQIDEAQLKQICIWGVYQLQADTLERNEFDAPLVPTADVDLYARNLFGPSFNFSAHESFNEDTFAMVYEYLPELNSYVMPITGLDPDYLPTVVEIVRETGGYRRVVVGYASTRNTSGAAVVTVDYEHPVRYMDFVFRRDGSEYYLERVERNTTHEVTMPDDATSSPPTPVIPEDESSQPLPEEDIVQEDSSLSMEDEGAPDESAEPAGE